MYKVKGMKKIILIYVVIIAFFSVLSVFLFFDVNSLSSTYAVQTTNMNISGLCTQNKSVMILYYGNSCQSCSSELQAFENISDKFGSGSVENNTFLSPYFCAWDFNISAYNLNKTVDVPSGALNLFAALSDSRIPFIFFGGTYAQYYKIGGFSSETLAEQNLLKYMCLSINNVAPACASG